ncbi:hypothetical protein O1611_g6571 [Lasiodiplodia mahajangana]|uniref:Uncharacterized protein n=1 Tax=Lasiodiplodia mahajangana TaxID=1108764 RepID=A0ACC2JHX3_9PEZI|nr:hypothetical protein O1611_g6571 [Lasiodiplodia mahajangana]
MATPPSNDYAMPTRLIDVGSPSQPPRLVTTSELQVAPYITLSYCWGTSGKNLRTTKSNLDSMTEEIEWRRLPKTVQDAITFVRALGVRYLWVDALCIVQHEFLGDEGSDWDVEALRMGQYYQHSLCTIVIAGSSDCDQGFLADRLAMKYPIQADELEIKGIDGKSRLFHSPLPSWSELIDDSPLSSRGWCMQERLLSSRVLFFSRHCIFWECVEAKTAEFLPDWDDFQDRYARARVLNAWNTDRRAELLSSETIPGLHGAWYNFVATYSKKNFTNRADGLVAVASVAGLFEERIKSAYRAGLWEDSLAFGMCWSRESTWNEVEKHAYTAPTWSWASAEGAIEYESVSGKEFDNWISNIEILNISVTAATGDPKGRVLAGAVRIKGLMAMFCPAEGRSRSAPPQPSRYHNPFKVDWDSKAFRKLYSKEWLPVFRIGILGSQGNVYCTVLLILKPTGHEELGVLQYERIGIIHWFAIEWEGEGSTPLREEIIELV